MMKPEITKYEWACIVLQIPQTGDPRLDALIQEARDRHGDFETQRQRAIENIRQPQLLPEGARVLGRVLELVDDKSITPADAMAELRELCEEEDQ